LQETVISVSGHFDVLKKTVTPWRWRRWMQKYFRVKHDWLKKRVP